VIEVGDRVRIKGAWTTVIGTYDDIEGGLIVAPRVRGFRSWNESEVTEMEKDCSCGVRIRMLKNLVTGRVSPITVEPSSKGNVVIGDDGYWRVKKEGDKGPFYLNHFVDCPDAKRYGGAKAGDPKYRDTPEQPNLFESKVTDRYTR
jgi:hypothetical protein